MGCNRRDDPFYKHRRALLTKTKYPTHRQKQRLDLLWATDDDYIPLELTCGFWQNVIAVYLDPRSCEGTKMVKRRINTLSKGLPAGLERLAQPCGAGVVAYFSIGASNGPVEAINRRFEHLGGIALGLRNQDYYILLSLIHSSQLRDRINAL